MQNKRKNNQTQRNETIREEVKQLTNQGLQMKLAISMVADKWFLSEVTIRDIIYDKRRA